MATPFAIEPIAAPPPQVPHEEEKTEIRQRVWGLDARTDDTVTFEEYSYWAEVEREEERVAERKYRELQGPWTFKKMIMNRFSKGVHHETKKRKEQQRREEGAIVTLEKPTENALTEKTPSTEKNSDNNVAVQSELPGDLTVSEEEWKTAARALRTASWGSIFFLITTDILGWSGCP